MTHSSHPYDKLTPDRVIAAVESIGFRCDGRMLPLNSYENRVYQIGIEEGAPLIAKFYRPNRWSTNAILEEHRFAQELVEAEIPVIPPIAHDGRTLFEHGGFRFCIYERRGGRWPELATEADREWIGRFLGRIHMVGRRRSFEHRPMLTVERFGIAPRKWLLEANWIPEHLVAAYETVSDELLDAIRTRLDGAHGAARLHGDCHPGNVLWTDDGPHFVDLDDCMTGPAIQDLWMLLSGSRSEMSVQMRDIVEGYAQFAEFDPVQL